MTPRLLLVYSLEQMQLEAIGAKQKKCVGVVSFGGEHWTEAQHEAGAFRGCPVIISQSTFEVSKIELKVDFQFNFSLINNPAKILEKN